MKKRSTQVYPIRHHLRLSRDQYRKLKMLAVEAKCSMGAILRLLLDEAK